MRTTHIKGYQTKTTRHYERGHKIAAGSELVGVLKGRHQVAIERRLSYETGGCNRSRHINKCLEVNKVAHKAWVTDKTNKELFAAIIALPTSVEIHAAAEQIPCNCVTCILGKQQDFKNALSALEELYTRRNYQNNNVSNHRCIFLPKFHPELNPIERVWSRMKWYTRKHADGTIDKLRMLMEEGIQQENLPLKLIRKYIRLCSAYLLAYDQGHDIVTANAHIKKYRSHRSHSRTTDAALDNLYFPSESLLTGEISINDIDMSTDEDLPDVREYEMLDDSAEDVLEDMNDLVQELYI